MPADTTRLTHEIADTTRFTYVIADTTRFTGVIADTARLRDVIADAVWCADVILRINFKDVIATRSTDVIPNSRCAYEISDT